MGLTGREVDVLQKKDNALAAEQYRRASPAPSLSGSDYLIDSVRQSCVVDVVLYSVQAWRYLPNLKLNIAQRCNTRVQL